MNNAIDGTDGPDTIVGSSDEDVIQGFEGDDVIWPGRGFDWIYAGGGDDVIVYRPRDLRGDQHDFIVNGEHGIDALLLYAEKSARFPLFKLGDIGGLQSLEVLQFYGTQAGSRVEVTADKNVFKHMGGRNSFDGDVVVSGSPTADVADVLILNAWVNPGEQLDFSTLVFDRWGSEDQVQVRVTSSPQREGQSVTATQMSDRVTGDQWHNRIYGDLGNDQIIGLGGSDRLFGGKGRDTLDGGESNDRLLGNSGNDRLLGGLGDDSLAGHSGRDRLEGGVGSDQLTGGRGADVFVFKDGDGHDTIIDFGRGNDRLRLDEDIWGGELNIVQMLDQYARVEDGSTYLDFDSQLIRLEGYTDLEALVDDITLF